MKRYLVIDDVEGILGDIDELPREHYGAESFVDTKTNEVLCYSGDSWFVNDRVEEYDPEKDYSLSAFLTQKG